MNCRIYDSLFLKYSRIRNDLRLWILDEVLPIFWISMLLTLFYSSPFAIIIIVYMCLKWNVAIIFWLTYFLWILYDSKTLNGKGRKSHDLKYIRSMRTIRRYFPLRLIKLADLPPDRNYMLPCFPHAVLPFGCMFNFCTNTNNTAELFPNVDFRIATMNIMFQFPVAREALMALGFCTVNKENILNLLNSKPAKAVVIFPGGVGEYFLSHPGNVYRIIKNNRKGFIKLALESGSPLVPVFSFGEQNTLDQEPFKSTILVYINKFLKHFTRGEMVSIKGRGYFPQRYTALPHRRPVTTVVGKPIEVPKVENPSIELVDEYHEKFYTALQDLFDKYKYEYGEGEAAQLVME